MFVPTVEFYSKIEELFKGLDRLVVPKDVSLVFRDAKLDWDVEQGTAMIQIWLGFEKGGCGGDKGHD